MLKYYLLVLSGLLVMLLLPGCIVYSSVTYEIEYNDDFTMGTIKVTYTNLMDSESDKEKQEKDFQELIDMLQGDEFLLDILEDGIYLKDRQLYEQDGKLIGSYSGLFKRLKIDSQEMISKENERVLIIDKNDGDTVSSNGKILETADSYILSWPKDIASLEFTIKSGLGDPTYSLLDYYHNWKSK